MLNRIGTSRCRWLAAGLAASTAWAAETPGGPADWPQWRGPRRDAISTEVGLLKKWPEAGPPLVWTATGAGEGYSSVTLSNGRLFTMGNLGDREHVLAYDMKTGRQLWSRENGDAYENNRGNGPRGSVTIEEDRAYCLGANGDLSCRNVADGTPVWQVNLLKQFGGRNTKWGLSESPLIEKDLVICNAGGPDASLVALDKRTGKTVWTSKGLSDEASYSSSLAVTIGDVRQIIHMTHQNVVGVRAQDGLPLWRYGRVNAPTANVATPIYHDGHVFASAAYNMGGALLKLIPDGDKTRAEEVYFTKDMQNHHGGMVLLDGYLYGFSNAILTCLEFKTGKKMWSDRSVGKGCLVYADGHLYCLSEDGVVGLVEANPREYREVSRFKITRGRWPTWSHPVISHGRLFIRNQDTISCYDVSAKGLTAR